MSDPATFPAEVIRRGRTWNVRLVLEDENGDPVDLSLGTEGVALQVYVNGALALTKTKGVSGETAFEGAAGVDGDITFLVPPAATTALALGGGYAEVVRTNSAVTPSLVTTHVRWVILVRDTPPGRAP